MIHFLNALPSDFIVGVSLFTVFCFVCFFVAVILCIVATVFSICNYRALKRIEKQLNPPQEEKKE